jgi:hypothetical protein
MQALKIVTIAMAVLIVGATITLGVLISRKLGGTPSHPVAMTLDEPSGTRIASIAALPDRLAVQLAGGGPDRVIFLDARTLAPIGRVTLSASP